MDSPVYSPGLRDVLRVLELPELFEGGRSEILRNQVSFCTESLVSITGSRSRILLGLHDGDTIRGGRELDNNRRGGTHTRGGRANSIAIGYSIFQGRNLLAEVALYLGGIKYRAKYLSVDFFGQELGVCGCFLLICDGKADEPDGVAPQLLLSGVH
jgi:hypothetical protein